MLTGTVIVQVSASVPEKQAFSRSLSLSELPLYYCAILIIITISTRDNHTSLLTFDINGDNINKSPW